MNEPQNLQLFVYGSLRSGFQHPAYAYISRYFSFIGNATVKGTLFDMGEYPAALPAHTNDYIVGELYVLNNTDEFGWAFEQLDDYEGLHMEDNEPALYRREITTVYINDTTTTAWVYWFNGNTTGKPQVISGDVLQYIQQKNNR